MTVTRNVIIDLIPLYIANEVSDDSRALIESHLANDPQLTKMVEKMRLFDSAETPQNPTLEDEAKTFTKARNLRYQYNTLFLLGLLSTVIWLTFLFVGASPSPELAAPDAVGTPADFPGAGYIGLALFLLALTFWIGMFNIGRAMRDQ